MARLVDNQGEQRVPVVRPDVLIVGAGVAGLWLRARLARVGYATLTLETGDLADGQTIGSQGIIHGGVKYALGGAASRASGAIAPMPDRWRAALKGCGEVDLSGVRVLSEHHDLWTTGSLVSRLAGAVASRAVRTPGRALERPDYAPAFEFAFDGVSVYRVEEQVVDPRSLVEHLRDATDDPIVAIKSVTFEPPSLGRPGRFAFRPRASDADEGGVGGGGPVGTLLSESPMSVLCAGAGNEALLADIGARAREAGVERCFEPVNMQRRPLHQVLARSPELPPIYAHCVGASSTPRVTITSQTDSAGRTVWNIGGGIAEKGVERTPGEQIEAARRELIACLPWLEREIGTAEFASMRWQRAEGLTPDGQRPDEPVVREVVWRALEHGIEATRIVAGWPTKLAFAPLLADRIEAMLDPVPSQRTELSGVAHAPPPVARLPWERDGVAWTRGGR